MKVHVRFHPSRKPAATLELPRTATVGDVLAATGEHADVTIAVRGGTPIPEDVAVADGDQLLLISAASGG